jgi:small-conductance mechanosensitive channel
MAEESKLKIAVTRLVAIVTALLGAPSHDAETIAAQKAEIEKLKSELGIVTAERDQAKADDAEVEGLAEQLDTLANMAAAANPPAPRDVETAGTIGAAPAAPEGEKPPSEVASSDPVKPQEPTGDGNQAAAIDGPKFKE